MPFLVSRVQVVVRNLRKKLKTYFFIGAGALKNPEPVKKRTCLTKVAQVDFFFKLLNWW